MGVRFGNVPPARTSSVCRNTSIRADTRRVAHARAATLRESVGMGDREAQSEVPALSGTKRAERAPGCGAPLKSLYRERLAEALTRREWPLGRLWLGARLRWMGTAMERQELRSIPAGNAGKEQHACVSNRNERMSASEDALRVDNHCAPPVVCALCARRVVRQRLRRHDPRAMLHVSRHTFSRAFRSVSDLQIR